MENNIILPRTYVLGKGETSMKIEKMTIDQWYKTFGFNFL